MLARIGKQRAESYRRNRTSIDAIEVFVAALTGYGKLSIRIRADEVTRIDLFELRTDFLNHI